MPGPVHGGIVYAEQWAPGAGVAGTTQDHEIGDFNEDMIINGIYLQEGTGAVTSAGSLFMAKAGSRTKYNVFKDIFTNSPFFAPGNAGGKFELGVYLRRGEQAIFQVAHTGTDNLKWLIVCAPPAVSDRMVERVVEALSPTEKG